MRTILLSALLLVAGCGCVSIPTHSDLRATTHRIEVLRLDGGAICSATAIAADTLLTATHCMSGAIGLVVDDSPATVAEVTVEGDRATIRLSAPVFATWAQLGPTPEQGDRVRWWGNPRGIADVYREAVVASVQGGVIAVGAMVCHGDSGAGIFDAAGQVVAVISRMAPDVAAPCVFGVAEL